MDRVETSPPVRIFSERSACPWRIILGVGAVILIVLSIIGLVIYFVVTAEPYFNYDSANSMVDNAFGFYMKDELPICQHSILHTKFNGSSPFHRDKDCIQRGSKRFDNFEIGVPYFEYSFHCVVSGNNVSVQNKFSYETCKYDGDFKIYLTVSNRTRGGDSGGNLYKLSEILIEFEQKTDYSKPLGEMVRGFSWVSGETISRAGTSGFIKNYANEDYGLNLPTEHSNQLIDFEGCRNFWPCPTRA